MRIHAASPRVRVLPDRVSVRASAARSVLIGTHEKWVEIGPECVELENDAQAWPSST